MPLVNKTLLRTGIYEAPQGTLRANRARIAGWVDTFKRMRAAGLEIPICWGHQPEAQPAGVVDRARQQYWLGAYNAGYLRDLSLTPDGSFDGKLDCPGVELKDGKLVHWIKMPDGRQVQGAIGEVSIAVRPFRDGTGKDWGESVVHVGLTPLPVASGMGGFTASAACNDPRAGFTLSLAQFTRTLAASEEAAVAEDKMDDKPFAKKEPDGDETGGGSHFSDAIDYLRNRGIAMPEDTTEDNFLERICVACHALENQSEEVSGEDLNDDGQIGDMDEGATYGGEDVPQEEPRPMTMSLVGEKDPKVKALGRAVEKSHKADLLKRITRLERRGIRPAKAASLRAEVENYTLGYTMSNDGEIQIREKRLDQRIADMEEDLPGKHPLMGSKSRQVSQRPGGEVRQESDAEIERRAGAVGRGVR